MNSFDLITEMVDFAGRKGNNYVNRLGTCTKHCGLIMPIQMFVEVYHITAKSVKSILLLVEIFSKLKRIAANRFHNLQNQNKVYCIY